MSFDGIDLGFNESKRRKKASAIPSFTGDIDLGSLARGTPFPSSEVFGKTGGRGRPRQSQTIRNLNAQRGIVGQTPLRIKAEGNIEDAFLTDPLSAPSIDPSRKSNGKRKKGKQNKRDKGRANLLNERNKLKRGGAPKNVVEQETFSENDFSFRSLGV